MKQLLLALTIITGIASCKNSDDAEKTGAVQLLPAVATYNSSAISDTSNAVVATTPQQTAKTITKIIYVTKRAPVIYRDKTPVMQAPVPVATQVTPPIPTSETSGPVTAPAPGTINDNKDISSTVPETVKKKGWSSAAKGAAIGAGTGAIGGAILSKKKGLGAIVGGVVGAAGGYIIGKNIDKKNANN